MKALACAIIRRAILDLRSTDAELKSCAYAFLFSNDRIRRLDRQFWCQIAGVDPDWFSRKLYAKEGKSVLAGSLKQTGLG